MATITVSDIKLLASTRMSDASDGGGQMTGTPLQDGAENNVFPDISSTDRAFGRLALRKVYPAVLNTATDALLGAHVILDDLPDDPNVTAFALLGTGPTESRAEVLARLEQPHWATGGSGSLQWANTPYLYQRLRTNDDLQQLEVGAVVDAGGNPVIITSMVEVLSSDGSYHAGFTGPTGKTYTVTYDGTPGDAETTTPVGPAALSATFCTPNPTSPRIAGTRPVTGTLSIGATYCDVDTLLTAIVPRNLGAAASSAAQIGIDSEAVMPGGRAVAFRSGDGLVIHHTATVAAATYSNGNTINCGRAVDSVRLVGANGASIPAGWTVNLATGVVTVSDITGWSQPVTVRHTIQEVVACSRTGYPERPGGSGGTAATAATAPFVLTGGLTMFCGRPNVGVLRVISKTGQDITDSVTEAAVNAFAINLAAGTATFAGSGAVSAFITSHSPVTLVSSGTYAAIGAATAPQAPLNRITFNRPLAKAFPSGTLVSSMLLLGDMQARVGASFAQATWTNVWADERIDDPITPQYNQAANPITVTNAGALSERWALIFLTSTTFRVVGQTLGQIATGDVNSLCAPNNPATGQPYFSIPATGWGGGWAAGQVLRFNTTGANAPVWVGRAVLPSPPSSTPDSLTIAVRGDIDA